MRKIIILAIFFNLFFLLGNKENLFSQLIENSNNADYSYIVSGGDLSDQIDNAFKKAMHNFNEESANREAQFSAQLSAQLEGAVENWIAQESKVLDAQMNQLVEQNWEHLFKYGPYIHYDYFLRAYDFSIHEFDIIKTGSVIAPYRGMLELREVLYVERNYAKFNSNPRNYCYSVNIPINVRFDYRNGEFVAGTVERMKQSIEEDWPEEIFEKVKFTRP
ncbi:MAG: hypothetical protein PHY94_00565 [Candidatus Omnitrophica bacterium]|nr:hypothetical protein [Candidatus Omnitrophota bacterium]